METIASMDVQEVVQEDVLIVKMAAKEVVKVVVLDFVQVLAKEVVEAVKVVV